MTLSDRQFAILSGLILLLLDLLLTLITDSYVVPRLILFILGLVLLCGALLAPGLFTGSVAQVDPSPRATGLTLTLLTMALSASLFWQAATAGGVLAALIGLALLITSLIKADAYRRPAETWGRFSRVLHQAMTPVLLGLVYYGCFVPIGLGLKLFGKDPLRRRADPAAPSYWITREPPGPEPDSIRMQF